VLTLKEPPPVIRVEHRMDEPPFGPFRVNLYGSDGLVATFDTTRAAGDWLLSKGYQPMVGLDGLWVQARFTMPITLRLYFWLETALKNCARKLSNRQRSSA
jgi:hypothetical protein